MLLDCVPPPRLPCSETLNNEGFDYVLDCRAEAFASDREVKIGEFE
jgi:hypothetical protein